MALWMVRAGARGEQESLALDNNVAVIGWDELPDLSTINSKKELFRKLEKTYPDSKPKTLQNWMGQIWSFLKEIQEGDLVALPLKQRPMIAFGRVSGPYQYRSDFPNGARHTRPVKWIKEIPRSDFDQDLLYSFGAFMTVCRIRRNDAERRVKALLKGKKLPPIEEAEGLEGGNLEELALDQIRTFVARKFKGHRLAELVAALLRAQGYKVHLSPAGPDGGVDILAGSGPMGLDSPRIVVQVKSGTEPASKNQITELQGAMKNFRADQGLFVSWAGFKHTVSREIAQLFFEIRLWDSDDLLREILQHYEELPEDLQAELPLKRIWMLVPSEDLAA